MAYESFQELLKKNRNLLDDNRFEELYYIDFSAPWRGYLTSILHYAKINPLLYMKKIPSNFLYGASLKEISIPDTIKEIGVFAFMYSNIDRISLPISIKFIDKEAFRNCPVKIIEYEGTRDQWNNIHKHPNWNSKSELTEIHCTEGILFLPYLGKNF